MEDSIEKTNLEEKQPKSVEISMGTLFTVKISGKETDRIDVITDIGEGRDFLTGRVYEDKDGKYFMPAGTGSPEIFGRVVGNMSLKEMIKAFKLGLKKFGYGEPSKKELNILRKSAKKDSRTILLS